MKPSALIGVNGDTIDLCDPDLFVTTDPVFGIARPTIRYRTTRWGRRVERHVHDMIACTFEIRVASAQPSEIDRLRERVADALRSRTGDARVTLIIEREDGSRRALTGIDIGDDPRQASQRATNATIPVQLEAVESPYWIDLQSQEIETVIGVVGVDTPWVGEMPMAGATDATYIAANGYTEIGWEWDVGGYFISDAEAQTLNMENPGPLSTWPEWEISGPATLVELAHERTGQVWKWEGTLASGDTLRVVTDPVNGRTVEIESQPAWSGVDPDSTMSELLPGSNRVQIRVEGGADPNTLVAASFFARYTSP